MLAAQTTDRVGGDVGLGLNRLSIGRQTNERGRETNIDAYSSRLVRRSSVSNASVPRIVRTYHILRIHQESVAEKTTTTRTRAGHCISCRTHVNSDKKEKIRSGGNPVDARSIREWKSNKQDEGNERQRLYSIVEIGKERKRWEKK